MSLPPCVILAEEVWGSALHAIRTLGRDGVPVLVATAGSGAAIYGRSRHCLAAADFDPSDPIELCRQVAQWASSLSNGSEPITIIPLSDRLVEWLHRSRSSFGPGFVLAIPEPQVAEALLDKVTSFEIAERAGLDVPPWLRVADRSDIDATVGLKLPVAVRPTSWATVGDEYLKVAMCRDRPSLVRVLNHYLDHGAELVVQEYIDATDSDVEVGILWRSRDRAATAVCTGRKRRQAAPDGGVMVWGESTELADVRAHAERFLDESGFTGLGGIEFIRSGSTAWFIEFNPRLEAIHFLATSSGVDTVRMEYRDLALGEVPTVVAPQHRATAWVGSAWLTRLSSDWSTWPSALADRWAFARSPRRVRAVWSWRDPSPAMAVTSRLARRALIALVRSDRRRGLARSEKR